MGDCTNEAFSAPSGASPFERNADRYDEWFDTPKGSRIFQVEVACIRDLLIDVPHPWLEVGVGTGRFAKALAIDEGVDASPAVLRYALQRGIQTQFGRAEALPYVSNRFQATLLITTVCFLQSPSRALDECRRVLREDGCLIVGLIPKDSLWGSVYARLGAEAHPIYSAARFYTSQEVVKFAERAGFYLSQAMSCLFEKPDHTVDRYEHPQEGLVKGAGFVGMRFGTNKSKDFISRCVR